MRQKNQAAAEKTAKEPSWRKVGYITLLLVGTGLLLGVALVRQELQDAALVVLGVLVMEAGILGLAHKLLPNQRKYTVLRNQGDQFLVLLRLLHAVALRAREYDTPKNRQSIEDVREKMRHLVDRMVATAGRTDVELAADAAQTRQEELAGVAS